MTETAKAMGVTTPVDAYPATAIGGLRTGVGVLEIASAYSTFAAGGIHHDPYAIERVDSPSFGETNSVYDQDRRTTCPLRQPGRRHGGLEEGCPERHGQLLPQPRQRDRTLLRRQDRHDRRLRGRPWYIGYTPRLSTAVWVGYPDSHKPMRNVHGESVVNGETLPMDIWSTYTAGATGGDPVLDFPGSDRREFVPLVRGYVANPAPAQSGGATALVTTPPRDRLAGSG